MLRTLIIKNFVLVDYQEINFAPGFNVVTGETGAGKSLLINAFSFLLGARPREEWIRKGSDFAQVEGWFDISFSPLLQEKLKEKGWSEEIKGGMVLSREVNREGKSKAHINGRSVTLAALKEVTSHLVDIYGQGENNRFLTPENKLAILDSFLDEEGKLDRENYLHLKEERNKIKEKIQELKRGQEVEIEEIREMLEEMEKMGLTLEKIEEVEEQFQRCVNSQRYQEIAEEIIYLISGAEEKEGFLSSLRRVRRNWEGKDELALFPPSVEETLKNIELELQEVLYQVEKVRNSFDFSPLKVEELEKEVAEIERWKRKYHCLTTKDLISFIEEKKIKLSQLYRELEELEEWERELEIKEKNLMEAKEKLFHHREKAAKVFKEKLEKELKELSFSKVALEIELEKKEEDDEVSFLISLNPGEPLFPVEQVASGGELSRIILAIKSLTREVRGIPILVFDEIDQGVGGQTAFWVGDKLRRIATGHQVISITHLPQIACFAHHHLKVEKRGDEESTWVEVSSLSEEERIKELARMMGDGGQDNSALQYAETLMKRAQNANT
ncbi:MAG TPA: hypothetical protein PK016_00680 [Candidatus Atribacteria bacterium]|nr:hypothetical protein [Candidatus Atribacteria bacterium]